MLFPVIKIKEEDREHIVGTNSHDHLYIENNAIHYLNAQCMVGTQYPEESGMYFVSNGIEPEYTSSGNPEVQFMTLEEIIELAMKSMEMDTEAKIHLNEVVKKYEDKRKECAERLAKSEKETGVGRDTSGRLF